MNLQQVIEREAAECPSPLAEQAFISGANFALGLDRWVKIEPSVVPDIPIDHDNRSINVILTDGEERVSSGYYNFNRQMWFWADMAMENATHYMLQELPLPPQP